MDSRFLLIPFPPHHSPASRLQNSTTLHCCRLLPAHVGSEGFLHAGQWLLIKCEQYRDKRRTAFLVWIKTVPGPVNLHTNPSPDARPEMMPPEDTRSRTYFVFQATRCPLSTMYFSPSASYSPMSVTLIVERQLARSNSHPSG